MFCKKTKKNRACILGYSILFFLAMTACKNTAGPDNELTAAWITVNNDCGIAVDIYMDNGFQFSLEYQENKTITDIALGNHDLESKKKGTDTLLSYLSVELTQKIEFVWTLESEASFHVTNDYGESLEIYGDGDLLSDIGDLGTLIIQNVLYGEHAFKALRQSDGTEIASITIDIAENKAYFWTIEK